MEQAIFTFDVFFALLGAAGITGGVVATAIVWLAKTYLSEKIRTQIKHEYDQKLETHKAQIKAQSDVEVEKLRSQLSVAAAERHIRFSNLHEKRAEVIAEVYAALTKVLFAIASYVRMFESSGIPSRADREKTAVDAINAFSDSYRPQKIFIPKTTAVRLDQVFDELRGAHIDCSVAVDHEPQNTERTKRWVDVHKKVEHLAKVAMSELEDDLRKLLGDD